MRLLSLALAGFRNYATVHLPFSPHKNVFLGQNGQGKTNLLEAIYVLSHSRSHRTANERELLNAAEPTSATDLEGIVLPKSAHVELLVRSDVLDVENRLSVHYTTDRAGRMKAKFKADGVLLKSRSQLIGRIPTVSFFNTDLLLVRGAPSDRRRWLDAAVSQYDVSHMTYVAEYNKVRQQKAQLLKQNQGVQRGGVTETLSVWNEQMARLAARLVLSRLSYLSVIQTEAKRTYLDVSGGQEQLYIAYHSSIETVREQAEGCLALNEGDSNKVASELSVSEKQERSVMLASKMLQAFEVKQSEELRRGQCLIGPHRDDLRFNLLNHKGVSLNAMTYASQGQQRTVVLSLKLAELKALTEQIGEHPVLLLDDVMAELDPSRQQYLMTYLDKDVQVFLTTTHLDPQLTPLMHQFVSAEDSSVFRVCDGTVIPENLNTASDKLQPVPVEAANGNRDLLPSVLPTSPSFTSSLRSTSNGQNVESVEVKNESEGPIYVG